MSERQEDIDLRVLEYISDNDKGSKGPAGLAGLRDLLDEDAALATAASLRERGLIRRGNRMGDGYHITPEGRTQVDSVKAKRGDRGLRRRECREQLLQWVDGNTTPGDPGTRVDRRDFDGTMNLLSFDAEEVISAAAYLADFGLIKTYSAAGRENQHHSLLITEKGRDCVDSGTVAEYLERERYPGGGQTLNVHGTGHNLAVAQGERATANATQINFSHEKSVDFAKAVRESLSLPALSALPDTIEDDLANIEQDSDLSLSQRATLKVYGLLLDIGKGGVAGILAAYGAQALGFTG